MWSVIHTLGEVLVFRHNFRHPHTNTKRRTHIHPAHKYTTSILSITRPPLLLQPPPPLSLSLCLSCSQLSLCPPPPSHYFICSFFFLASFSLHTFPRSFTPVPSAPSELHLPFSLFFFFQVFSSPSFSSSSTFFFSFSLPLLNLPPLLLHHPLLCCKWARCLLWPPLLHFSFLPFLYSLSHFYPLPVLFLIFILPP